jgi:hypothetical protein
MVDINQGKEAEDVDAGNLNSERPLSGHVEAKKSAVLIDHADQFVEQVKEIVDLRIGETI